MTKIKIEEISFRDSIKEISSTTYATFGLYSYPAKFIPQIIAYILKNYAKPKMSVFDPFGGYGTVGVVSRIYGYDYELWDLNPMLKLLHEVSIMRLSKEVDIQTIMHSIKTSNKNFMPDWKNIEYWFPKEFLKLLRSAWGYYHNCKNNEVKRLILIPLLKTTRIFSYNDNQRQKLSKSPYSKERVAKLLDGDYETAFYKDIEKNLRGLIKSLKEYDELDPKRVKYTVKAGVDITKENLSQSHGILITSPPYLQAQEYIRNSKIDLFWTGFSAEQIKELGKKELPYGDVEEITIHSKTYREYRDRIKEADLLKVYDRYFWGVLGALTKLQNSIASHMFLFVGSANMRNMNIPLYQIFTEHFTALGWKHEITYIDKIVAKKLFSYRINPATGKADNRMTKEQLVVLKKG